MTKFQNHPRLVITCWRRNQVLPFLFRVPKAQIRIVNYNNGVLVRLFIVIAGQALVGLIGAVSESDVLVDSVPLPVIVSAENRKRVVISTAVGHQVALFWLVSCAVGLASVEALK